MLFDTHCHLNFKTFDDFVDQTVSEARESGVNRIVVPATDYETAVKAIKIAEHYKQVFAAVGIHPHHIYQFHLAKIKDPNFKVNIDSEIKKIEKLLKNNKVVAIGEVGLDRHMYKKTKYDSYQIEEKFMDLQKIFLISQIKLAVKHNISLILHNREAGDEFIKLMTSVHDKKLEGRTVFHCCEPDERLLTYAIDHNFFIGVDGDVIYDTKKQEFVKKIPINLLVLETDSPFLSPYKKFPNSPKNIPYIAEFVAALYGISIDELQELTTNNANSLFRLF